VFCNLKKDKIKILYFEHSGFWLYYKRLEKGNFKWPGIAQEDHPLHISVRELTWLLDGLSIYQEDAHVEVTERIFI